MELLSANLKMMSSDDIAYEQESEVYQSVQFRKEFGVLHHGLTYKWGEDSISPSGWDRH